MTLSVAIATYNGDRYETIERCIKSVYSFCDEIVIVYGSPKDETIKKIEKADYLNKIKIIISDNPPMFHINKQKAISACTKKWVLQLDADEVVSEELKKEIIQTINSTNKKLKKDDAFWIPRLTYFLGRPLTKGGQYPDYTIRLYRKGIAKFPCKSLHENVKIKEKYNIGYLRANLLHFPWDSLKEYFNKGLIRYSQAEALYLYKKGKRPSVINFIKYCLILPIYWFLLTYIRHKGFVDGYAGFMFSLFSSFRFPVIYWKLISISSKRYNLKT